MAAALEHHSHVSPFVPRNGRRTSTGSEDFSWSAQMLTDLRKAPATTPPHVVTNRAMAATKGQTGLSLLAQLLSPSMSPVVRAHSESSGGISDTTSGDEFAYSAEEATPSPVRRVPRRRGVRGSTSDHDEDMLERYHRHGGLSRNSGTPTRGRATPGGGDSSSSDTDLDGRSAASTKSSRSGSSRGGARRAGAGTRGRGRGRGSRAAASASASAGSGAATAVRGAKTNAKTGGGSRSRKFTSTFHGVSWHKRSQRWAVQIRNSGKRIHVGYFSDELQAALAYDKVARDLRGDRARVNFDEEGGRASLKARRSPGHSPRGRHARAAPHSAMPGLATKKTAAIAAAAVAKAAANGASLPKRKRSAMAKASSSRSTSGSSDDSEDAGIAGGITLAAAASSVRRPRAMSTSSSGASSGGGGSGSGASSVWTAHDGSAAVGRVAGGTPTPTKARRRRPRKQSRTTITPERMASGKGASPAASSPAVSRTAPRTSPAGRAAAGRNFLARRGQGAGGRDPATVALLFAHSAGPLPAHPSAAAAAAAGVASAAGVGMGVGMGVHPGHAAAMAAQYHAMQQAHAMHAMQAHAAAAAGMHPGHTTKLKRKQAEWYFTHGRLDAVKQRRGRVGILR